MVEVVELRADGSEGEQLKLLPSTSLEWQQLEPGRAKRDAACRGTSDHDDKLPLKFIARSKPLLLQYKPIQFWPQMELPDLLRPMDHWPLPARPAPSHGGKLMAFGDDCSPSTMALIGASGGKRRRADADSGSMAEDEGPPTPSDRSPMRTAPDSPPAKRTNREAVWHAWRDTPSAKLSAERNDDFGGEAPAANDGARDGVSDGASGDLRGSCPGSPLPAVSPLALLRTKRKLSHGAACYGAHDSTKVSLELPLVLENIQTNLSGLAIARPPAKRMRSISHAAGSIGLV